MMELHLPLQALGKIFIGALSPASNVVFKVTDQQTSNANGCRNGNNYRNCISTHNEAKNETSTTMVTTGTIDNEQDNLVFVFSQESNMQSTKYAKAQQYHIPNDWILSDSQSTVDVFSNAMLLKNIHESKSSMKIHCTAGVTETNLVGTFPAPNNSSIF
jgi:protein tyrosine phosphatase